MKKILDSTKSFGEISSDRKDICMLCDSNTKKDIELGKCDECGCFLTGKVNIPVTTCPRDLWLL